MQLQTAGQSADARGWGSRCAFRSILAAARRIAPALLAICALTAALPDAAAQTSRADAVTTDAVESAIGRAIAYLKAARQESGSWEKSNASGDKYWAGDTGLALLALLYAGEDPKGTEMAADLDWLAGQTLNATYVYAVRAHALALIPGNRYRERLQDDMKWLADAMHPAGSEHPGAWGYISAARNPGGWYDNSNSQFGVLGAWMASEAGARIPDEVRFWKLIESHWLKEQRPDGSWSYQSNWASSGSMTAAGLATLFVVLDRLHSKSGYRDAENLLKAIDRAQDWIGREFTPDNPHGDALWKYYYLYAVERAGRASGQKYFRRRDWFREGAADLIEKQREDGSWGNGLHDTCFGLMFLSHGRSPLLMNKLRHAGDWDVYRRDAAGLVRYADRALERLFNWQIVDLNGSLDDLLESPLLYINGQVEVDFEDSEVARLREYCRRGGMIFCVPAEDEEGFTDAMRRLAEQMFPDLPLTKLSNNHPMFNGEIQFSIAKPPDFFAVSTGRRILFLLCTAPISRAWNEYRVGGSEPYFQLGCNVYGFATDKAHLLSRLDSPAILLRQTEIKRDILVARIAHDGEWDPEPWGWERFAIYMNNTADTRLRVEREVRLDSADLLNFRVAHICGSGPLRLSAAEQAGLRRFLVEGGTLLADAVGGSAEFTASLEEQVAVALGQRPSLISPNSPLVTAEGLEDGVQVKTVNYRRALRGAGSLREAPPIRQFELGPRAAVLYSPVDITMGLLGTQVFGCAGYAPDDALRVLRNMVLYGNLTTAEKARLAR